MDRYLNPGPLEYETFRRDPDNGHTTTDESGSVEILMRGILVVTKEVKIMYVMVRNVEGEIRNKKQLIPTMVMLMMTYHVNKVISLQRKK